MSSSEISSDFQRTTQRHIPAEGTLQFEGMIWVGHVAHTKEVTHLQSEFLKRRNHVGDLGVDMKVT
jgi:hypothetical protein